MNLLKVIFLAFMLPCICQADIWEMMFGPSEPSTQEIRNYATFRSSPGVETQDLAFYEQEIVAAWQGRKLMKDSSHENIDFQVFYNLNLEAATIWREIVLCYGSNIYLEEVIAAARTAYLDKKIICGERTSQILERLKILHLNIKNWAESVEQYRSLPLFGARIPNFPPLHPLLGQITVELHSYYKYELKKLFGGSLPEFFNATSIEVSGALYSCRRYDEKSSDTEMYKACAKVVPILKGFELTQRLLDAGASSCITFGFWPNSTIYLFMGKVLTVGKVYFAHPAINSRNDQIAIEEFIYEQNGQVWTGAYFIFWDRSLDQRISLQRWNGSNQNEILAQARSDYAKKYGQSRGLTPPSCWQNKEAVMVGIERAYDTPERLNMRIHGMARFYSSYFKYYSGL